MITQVTAAAMTMNNAQCRNLSGGLQTVILAGMWSPCRSLASVRTDGIPAIRGCGCAAADDKIQDGSPEWNGDPSPFIRAGRGRGCAWGGGGAPGVNTLQFRVTLCRGRPLFPMERRRA